MSGDPSPDDDPIHIRPTAVSLDDDVAEELSPLVLEAVGQALHTHFRAIAEMPLPDRLLVLLAELEARERAK